MKWYLLQMARGQVVCVEAKIMGQWETFEEMEIFHRKNHELMTQVDGAIQHARPLEDEAQVVS